MTVRSTNETEKIVLSDVEVTLDDRVRLLSALLAASRYPDEIQKTHLHGTHMHARRTQKQLSGFSEHPAVIILQNLLQNSVPLTYLFKYMLMVDPISLLADTHPDWIPVDFGRHLRDFAEKAKLSTWWQQEQSEWSKSFTDCEEIFATIQLKPFLEQFIGPVLDTFLFMPNIGYPTNEEVSFRVQDKLFAIIPPRLAWGESPPWPFDEDPTHAIRAALISYGRVLMLEFLRMNKDDLDPRELPPLPIDDAMIAAFPSWQEQFTELFVTGATAIYLEDYISKQEADAYVLMERKVRGLTILPSVVSVLRNYLNELEAGKNKPFIELLPVFPKQLKLAKRFASL